MVKRDNWKSLWRISDCCESFIQKKIFFFILYYFKELKEWLQLLCKLDNNIIINIKKKKKKKKIKKKKKNKNPKLNSKSKVDVEYILINM